MALGQAYRYSRLVFELRSALRDCSPVESWNIYESYKPKFSYIEIDLFGYVVAVLANNASCSGFVVFDRPDENIASLQFKA